MSERFLGQAAGIGSDRSRAHLAKVTTTGYAGGTRSRRSRRPPEEEDDILRGGKSRAHAGSPETVRVLTTGGVTGCRRTTSSVRGGLFGTCAGYDRRS